MRSRIKMFPHIDLETQTVGIFGKIVKREAASRRRQY